MTILLNTIYIQTQRITPRNHNRSTALERSVIDYCGRASLLIRFARVSSHVDDFNTRNKVLTAKLLRQGYRYHKIRKAFSKFYRRHFDVVSKYNVGLKRLLLEGLSEPDF